MASKGKLDKTAIGRIDRDSQQIALTTVDLYGNIIVRNAGRHTSFLYILGPCKFSQSE